MKLAELIITACHLLVPADLRSCEETEVFQVWFCKAVTLRFTFISAVTHFYTHLPNAKFVHLLLAIREQHLRWDATLWNCGATIKVSLVFLTAAHQP